MENKMIKAPCRPAAGQGRRQKAIRVHRGSYLCFIWSLFQTILRAFKRPNPRCSSAFPHPYELKDAESWVNQSRFGDGGWKETKLDPRKSYGLPIVAVDNTKETEETVIGNIGFVVYDRYCLFTIMTLDSNTPKLNK